MCGICGLAAVDTQAPVSGRTIDRMMAELQHRGPDGSGVHVAPGVGLGFRRLSIIDLETGDQPIASEDGSIVVVCNGEIYNAPELRTELLKRGHRFGTRSDVEPIVHLYEDLGPECLGRLRGMFALAIWDARRRRLMLARDRLGIKPLAYAVTAEGLWFASESKAIVAGAGIGREANVLAIEDLLTFSFVTGGRTFFSGILRLQPGHYLLFAGGQTTVQRYWSPPLDAEETTWTQDQWAEAVRAKLEETVRIHLRSDVPVGAWLSPGIDSSSVTSLAYRALGRPLPTFTLAFADPAFDETRSRPTLDQFPGYDLPNERTLCDDSAFELYPKAIWHAEEPSADCVEISRMLLAKAASRQVKVVLTGEGSDELFCGYIWYLAERITRPFSYLPLWLRRIMLLGPVLPAWRPYGARLLLAPRDMNRDRYARHVSPLQPEGTSTLLSRDLRQRLAQAAGREDWCVPPDWMRSHSSLALLRYCDTTMRLPDLVIHTLDRGSMAYGLEARVPYLDHELVELCALIPPGLKLKHFTEKYILRRALKDVVPAEIRRRRKCWPIVPFERWLRQTLPDFAQELLSEASLRAKGYFDPSTVAILLARHRAGHGRFGRVLMVVLGVQMWDELFVQGRALH